MTPDEAEADEIEILAREMCRCAGDDPDATVLLPGWTLAQTMRGCQILDGATGKTRLGWMIYRRDAELMLERGWRRVGVIS